MPDIFVLQLPSLAVTAETPSCPVNWVSIDSQGVVTGPVGRGSLTEAAVAATGKAVRVLVPATDVFLTAPVFPARGAAKLLQLVPFALEDQLASDVELLHFALGRQRSDQSLPVAVIDHQRLRACLASLESVGIRPVSLQSEASVVPTNPAHAVIVLESGRLMVRQAQQLPISLDATPMLPALELAGLLPSADQADAPSASAIHGLLYVSAQDWPHHQADIDVLRSHLASLNVQVMADGVLPLLATGTGHADAINVLQGAYAPSTRFSDQWASYRWAGLAAAALLALHLGSLGVRFWHNHQQEHALDISLQAAAKSALPNSRALAQPALVRLAIENRVHAMRSAIDAGLMGALAIVADGFQGSDSVVESASYQEGRTTLTVDVPNSQILEQVRSTATARGWAAELQGSTPHDSRSRARLIIREPGQ